MKKQINEIKKMQLLAGLITESEYRESQINEAKITIGDDGYGRAEITVEKLKDGFLLRDKSKDGWPSIFIPTKDVQTVISFLSSSAAKEALSSEKMSERYDKSETKVAGLIPFKQVKQLFIQNYKEIVEPEDIAELDAQFKKCKNIDELVNVLNNYGMERDDVYTFVLSLLIK